MAGIVLVSVNGSALQLNPVGDLLALLAAFVWACYSILTRKITGFGFHTILTIRRVFSYSILFMIPALLLFGFRLDLGRFANVAELLMSDKGAFITGADFLVDDGATASYSYGPLKSEN